MLLFAHAQFTDAALELRLNTENKTFALFGEATGTPVNFSSYYGQPEPFFLWHMLDAGLGRPWPGGTESGSISYSNGLTFTTSTGAPFDGLDTTLSSSESVVSMTIYLSSFSEQTISGSGMFQSYLMDPGAMVRLESFDGYMLLDAFGSDIGPLKVTAVPEPRATTVILGVLCMVFVGWRKMSGTNQNASGRTRGR